MRSTEKTRGLGARATVRAAREREKGDGREGGERVSAYPSGGREGGERGGRFPPVVLSWSVQSLKARASFSVAGVALSTSREKPRAGLYNSPLGDDRSHKYFISQILFSYSQEYS
eukprot:scaffold199460_cov27-Tisochrysis_lutea.AAC.6